MTEEFLDKKRRITVQISNDMYKELENIAKQERRPVSTVVRFYVERGMTEDALIEAGSQIIAKLPNGTELIIASPQAKIGRLRDVARKLKSGGDKDGN